MVKASSAQQRTQAVVLQLQSVVAPCKLDVQQHDLRSVLVVLDCRSGCCTRLSCLRQACALKACLQNTNTQRVSPWR
jgi:hypothetical protein